MPIRATRSISATASGMWVSGMAAELSMAHARVYKDWIVERYLPFESGCGRPPARRRASGPPVRRYLGMVQPSKPMVGSFLNCM